MEVWGVQGGLWMGLRGVCRGVYQALAVASMCAHACKQAAAACSAGLHGGVQTRRVGPAAAAHAAAMAGAKPQPVW
jgi:hypothetical protein